MFEPDSYVDKFSLFWRFKKRKQAAGQLIRFERFAHAIFQRAVSMAHVSSNGKSTRKDDLMTMF